MQSLRHAARIQANVLGALIMREIHTRFGRQNLGYLWLFLEPMILAGCIALFHRLAGHGVPGDLEVFAFYIVGYTPYYLYRSILNRAPGTIEQNHALLHHARVQPLDLMVARSLLEGAAVTVAMGVFLLGLAIVTGRWPHDWMMIAAGIAWMMLLCHGFGLLLLAATAWGVATVERLVHPFTYLTIPVTGAFFMVWWFPSDWHWLITRFPTVHAFELTRAGYFGPVVPYHYDLGYLALSAAILNLLGMLALRAARARLEP
jgi:capsular polysaccharide transport system permease protein